MSDNLGTNIGEEAATGPLVEEMTSPKKRSKAAAAAVPDRVRIILEENSDIPPTGLFVGLNGRGYLLRAGEPIDVPLGVKEILDHAIMSSPVIDPQTNQVVGYRDRMRYSYRLVG